eukprot:3183682-Rhodomonas_salina.1
MQYKLDVKTAPQGCRTGPSAQRRYTLLRGVPCAESEHTPLTTQRMPLKNSSKLADRHAASR